MRLFIGITFKEEIINEIQKSIEEIKKHSSKGNFTKKDKIHLTLLFLGEVDENRLPTIDKSMNEISMKAFTLEINKIGKFKRQGGDIYWLGFKDCPHLQELYKDLYQSLSEKGFALEERPYTPHVTIGRKVVLNKKRDLESLSREISNLQIEVSEISLIQSHHVNGRLTYTPIITKALKG